MWNCTILFYLQPLWCGYRSGYFGSQHGYLRVPRRFFLARNVDVLVYGWISCSWGASGTVMVRYLWRGCLNRGADNFAQVRFLIILTKFCHGKDKQGYWNNARASVQTINIVGYLKQRYISRPWLCLVLRPEFGAWEDAPGSPKRRRNERIVRRQTTEDAGYDSDSRNARSIY